MIPGREQEQLDFMKALLTVHGDSTPEVEDHIDQHLRVLIDIMERKEHGKSKIEVTC